MKQVLNAYVIQIISKYISQLAVKRGYRQDDGTTVPLTNFMHEKLNYKEKARRSSPGQHCTASSIRRLPCSQDPSADSSAATSFM